MSQYCAGSIRFVRFSVISACLLAGCSSTDAGDPADDGTETSSDPSSGASSSTPSGGGSTTEGEDSTTGQDSTAGESSPTDSSPTSGGQPVCEGDVAEDGYACMCGCEEGRCIACGNFEASPAQWPVPDGERFEQIASNLHATFDINGDGLPDLVNAGDYATFEAYGSPGEHYWRVFLNEGDGFGTVREWPVPNGERFEQVASNLHATFDIDGDGLPDLVNAGDYATFEAYGSPGEHYWRVFLNEGDGFGPVREWPVPDGERFEQIASNLHATFDINGDGLPDLVNAGDYATFEAYGSPGEHYWRVFLNEGDGFGSVREWPVPNGERFEQVASNLHATFDINGDGLPDLVNAGDYATFEAYGSPGEHYWRVFLNEGDGFGSVREWPVPDGERFEQIASNLHATFDIDGDGLPDLVNAGDYATFEAYGSPGEHYWRVFLNEGDGFGSVREWPVPDGERFEQVASNLHATFDIDGDGLPDLVNAGNYADFEPYGSPGDRYWRVFLSAR